MITVSSVVGIMQLSFDNDKMEITLVLNWNWHHKRIYVRGFLNTEQLQYIFSKSWITYEKNSIIAI